MDTILLIVAVGIFVWIANRVLLLVFAGVLLAVALDALATLLARWTGLPRSWALLIVVLSLALLAALGVVALVPRLIDQIGEIWQQLSNLAEQAQDTLRQYPWLWRTIGDVSDELPSGDQSGIAGRVAERIAWLSSAIAGVLATVIVIVAIGLFVAANPAPYKHGLIKLVPRPHRPRVTQTISEIGHTLHWWLIGQLVSMTVLGTVTSLMLWALGVQLWLGLGVLTGVLTFIPFLGPIIAGVPVLAIAFTEGMQTGLIVLVLYLILQNTEGYFLTPMIQQRAAELPPALLISMQVLMGVLFGAPGFILAAPLTAAGLVAVNLLYIEAVLGEERAVPDKN